MPDEQTVLSYPEAEARFIGQLVALNDSESASTTAVAKYFLHHHEENGFAAWLLVDPRYRLIFQAALDAARNDVACTPERVAEHVHKLRQHKAFNITSNGSGGTDALIMGKVRELVQEGRKGFPLGARVGVFIGESTLMSVAAQRAMLNSLRDAEEEITLGEGDATEKYVRALARFQESAPPSKGMYALPGEQMGPMHKAAMQQRREMLALGIPYMALPDSWGMTACIPRLKPGEATLITGISGAGKTTIALDLAKFNATNGNGPKPDLSVPGFIHVLYFHLENIHQDLADRIVASHTGINTEELRRGERSDEVETAWQEMQPWVRNVTFVHCPGVKPEEIVTTIRRHAYGLPRHSSLLVIIDYLDDDKLDLAHIDHDKDAGKLGRAMNMFKMAAEEYTYHPPVEGQPERVGFQGNVHTVMLSQLNDTNQPYGSRKSKFFCQNWLELERRAQNARRDFSEIFNLKLPQHLQYETAWVEIGEMSPYARWKVRKVNDGRRGRSVIVMDGGHYRILGTARPDVWANLAPLDAADN